MEINAALLKTIAKQSNQQIITDIAPYFTQYAEKYEVNTLLRMAHFLGQCAEESAGFKTLHEYASGAEYEGRKDLGNIYKGDGIRYKGAGLLQITGRYNYDKYGKSIGIDLVNNPQLAQQPMVAVLVAFTYWHDHNLNAYADKDDIVTITKRINGGTNGLSDRKIYVGRAKKALGFDPSLIS